MPLLEARGSSILGSAPKEKIRIMHDFIAGLPQAAIDAFHQYSHERSYAAGATIYCQGDAPTEMFQVLSGGVGLYNYSVNGKEILTSHFLAGDCFGEMGLIDGQPRVSHARTVQATRVRVLPKSAFDRLLKQYPEFAQTLLLGMCQRLRYAYWQTVEGNGYASLEERLALTLVRLAHSKGVMNSEDRSYLSMSQDELARLLGSSRQTINKTLQIMVERGYVEVQYAKIYFRDIEAMRRDYAYIMGPEQVTLNP